jgi:DNA-binding transcriptional LysR family regulator
VLSAVTAHVREKRATWGIAIEDADMTDLDRKLIANVRLIPVVAVAHPLATHEGNVSGSSELANAVQILLGEHHRATTTTSDSASEESEDQGVFSLRTWRVIDLATKHALIASGLGWGSMPEHLVRDDLRAGRLKELKLDAFGGEPMTRALMLVWRRGVVMGPVARWAQERLSDLCAKAVNVAAEAILATPDDHHTK